MDISYARLRAVTVRKTHVVQATYAMIHVDARNVMYEVCAGEKVGT